MADAMVTHMCGELTAMPPSGYTGVIHSVFSSAFNMELADGRLVTALESGRHMQPYSVRFSRSVCIRALELTSGDDIRLDLGRLIVGVLEIPMADSLQIVSHRIQMIQGAVIPSGFKERLQVIAAAIGGCPGAEDGMAPILCGIYPALIPYCFKQNIYTSFLTERIKRLAGLLPFASTELLCEAGASIAGCGIGLTPSSDDFLCGVMAAMYGAGAAGMISFPHAQKCCTALAMDVHGRTGTISASFLQNSREGLFSENVLALLTEFFSQADYSVLQCAARRVADFGSTSGADILTGIWFALHALALQDIL